MKFGTCLFAFVLAITSAAIFAQQEPGRQSPEAKKDCCDVKAGCETKTACPSGDAKAGCEKKSKCGSHEVKSACGGEAVKAGCDKKSSGEANSSCCEKKASCGEAKTGCGSKQDCEGKSGCGEAKSKCGDESIKSGCASKQDCDGKTGCGEAKSECGDKSIKSGCASKQDCEGKTGCGEAKSKCGDESIKSGCASKQDCEGKTGCGEAKSKCGDKSIKSGCASKQDCEGKTGCGEAKSKCGGDSVKAGCEKKSSCGEAKSGCGEAKSSCGGCGGDHAEKAWEKGDGKGTINWLTHHERALQEARSQNKPLLLHFHANWCAPSRLFNRTTLSDGRVAELLNSTFVTAQFDVDACADLCAKYKLDLIPTVLVFTPTGVLLSRNVEMEPTPFLQRMQAVVSTFAQWTELQAQIEKDPSNATLHRHVGALLQAMGAISSAADAYDMAAELMAKNPNLTDDARREIGQILIWVSDTRVNGGAQKDEAPNVDRLADRFEAIDPQGKVGFADNALYLRAIAFGAREDGDKMIESLMKLRTSYPESDKLEAAIVWTAWAQLYLKKDKKGCVEELSAFVAKYPKSDYSDYAANLLKRANRMKID